MSVALAPVRVRTIPRSWALPVFVATIFGSAGLLFVVEPMITKALLPLLGGTPAVWSSR